MKERTIEQRQPPALPLAQTLAALPPEWPNDLLPEIQEAVASSGRKLVVLDDDPTGTQTVHDIKVLTEWSVLSLADELTSDHPCFYILTNSRSLSLSEAKERTKSIARNLQIAQQQAGVDIAVISRSDSTLRGHYPGELQVLACVLNTQHDATIIVPFFLEGGRYTIRDIHYVADGDLLIPAAQTPFAQDEIFGYRSSNLRAWVEEMTAGEVPSSAVASISIEMLRQQGPEFVTEILLALPRNVVCIVNAVSYRDLEVFVTGMLVAEARGRRYLYRTAASFVQVRAGVRPIPQLRPQHLIGPGVGGMVVVGSYVPKTTAQIAALLDSGEAIGVELHVDRLLSKSSRRREIAQTLNAAERVLAAGDTVVVYTSRQHVSGIDQSSTLGIAKMVSDSLTQVVQGVRRQPRFLVAKGGITASDIATKGLNVRKADILGQALPGVPVWRLGDESRFPGMPYVVFPGNVGDDQALVELVGQLI